MLYWDRSPKWKIIRQQHISQNHTCAGCGSKIGVEVHHIEPFHKCPEKELDPTNLISLCRKHCHLTIGHLLDYQSWNINVINDAKVYLEKVQNRPYQVRVQSYESTNFIHNTILWFKSLFSRNYRS